MAKEPTPTRDQIVATSQTIEDVVRQLIVPILKPSLLTFLLRIVTRVAPHGFDENDAKKRFDLDACAASLAFILAEPSFKDIEEAKLDITKKLWEKLRPFVSEDAPNQLLQSAEDQHWTPPVQAPASVKRVRDELPTRRPMNFIYPGMVRPALDPIESDEKEENDPPRNTRACGYLPSGGPAYYRHQTTIPSLHWDQKPRTPQSVQAVLSFQTPEGAECSGSLLSQMMTPRRSSH